LGRGEKKKKKKGQFFFLAFAFIVGNIENIILLRQQKRHYKSVAVLHIVRIQLEFRYLA